MKKFASQSLRFMFAMSIACSTTSSITADGGGKDGSSGGDAGKSGSDSCAQMVTCITQCPANDDPCANACFDKGSTAGQQKLLALVDCINKNNCMDPTCTQKNCATTLDACIQDVPAAIDSGIPPMMGTPLPAELVGSWQHASIQDGEDYTFKADGSYSSLFIYSNAGTCITIDKLVASIDGVANAQGTTLTLTPTMGTQTTTDCNNVSTMKPTNPPVRQFAWSVAGTVLTLTDSNGSYTYNKM